MRSAHQVEDRPLRPQQGQAAKAPGALPDRRSRLWNKGGDAPRQITGKDVEARARSAAYAVAGAAFHIAEKQYEDFLRIKFPEGLDFQQPSQYDSKRKQDATKKKKEESGKKFGAYLDDEVEAARQGARRMYLDVFKMKQAQWTIASAARVGQLYADFAGQLYTAEIPKDLKEQDQWGNQPAARSSATRWKTRPSPSRRRPSRASRSASRPPPSSPGTTSGRVCASASSTR